MSRISHCVLGKPSKWRYVLPASKTESSQLFLAIDGYLGYQFHSPLQRVGPKRYLDLS